MTSKRRQIAIFGLAGTVLLCLFPPLGRTVGADIVFGGFAPIWSEAGMLDPVRLTILIAGWWCVAGLIVLVRRK